MRSDNHFEALDKAALHNALIALGTCPFCRRDLQRFVYTGKGMETDASEWCCIRCDKTYKAPEGENK